MSAPEVTAYSLPSGGVISLAISGAVSGSATLERAVSGQAFVTISSGSALQLFLDAGELLPAPLDPTLFYQYRYTDSNGVTVTPFIQPASCLTVQPEPIIEILLRIIQGAINSLTLPTGIKRAEVTQAMPLGGSIPIPLVVINNDLTQQAAIPIGQSVSALNTLQDDDAPNSGFTITGFARRIYRVSVLSQNAPERNFYSDLLSGVFETIYTNVLQPLGIDVMHSWQVSRGQVAVDRMGKLPGFYYADAVWTFEGTLNVLITPDYGLISKISVTPSYPDGVSDTVEVPLRSNLTGQLNFSVPQNSGLLTTIGV